jgi:hypothetical protein
MENIIENNKLIIDFLGGRVKDRFNNGNFYANLGKTDSTWILIDRLTFHKSWDSLIRVVKHIEHELQFHFAGHKLTIKDSQNWDRFKTYFQKNKSVWRLNEYPNPKILYSTNITHVSNEVVEFIKWYNENKS